MVVWNGFKKNYTLDVIRTEICVCTGDSCASGCYLNITEIRNRTEPKLFGNNGSERGTAGRDGIMDFINENCTATLWWRALIIVVRQSTTICGTYYYAYLKVA